MNELSLFRCLAEPTRLTVLEHLAKGDARCVSDLVELTGKEQTNVSHHLAELRSCGLVVTEREGRQVFYQLAHPRLGELLADASALVEHIQGSDPEICLAEGCC